MVGGLVFLPSSPPMLWAMPLIMPTIIGLISVVCSTVPAPVGFTFTSV